jgi:hypothetical protein
MVKLIRLKSQQDKLLFNNNIQSDLIIKPNSKIALQNVSFEKANDEIVIDSTNNNMTFNNDTFTSTITLANRTYNQVNIKTLKNDIKEKLNASLTLNEWNLGKGFDVEISSDNFFTITTDTGPDLIPASDSDFTRTLVSVNPAGEMRKTSGASEGTPDAFVGSDTFPAFDGIDGCGVFRVQITALPTTGAGFYIGLSPTEPSNAGSTVPITDMTYAIRAQNTAFNYKYVNNDGTETTSSEPIENVSAGADNDYIEIGSHGGKIHLTVYNSSNPDGVDLVTASSYTGDELFPYIVFFDQTGVDVGQSYYVAPKASASGEILRDTAQPSLLGVANIVNQNRNDRVLRLEFESKALSDQLGFFDYFIQETTFDLNWKAIRTVRYVDETECYLVEALNLNFDSYDGSAGQEKRRNLLAVIQNIRDRNQADVLYDSNSLTYIDLNNPNPLPLRNLQFRIINSDEGEVAVDGFSNMTLLLD